MKISKTIDKKADASFAIKLTVPAKLVQDQYQEVLQKESQTVIVQGFRQGKAPTDLVEKQVGPENIYQKVIGLLVGQAYQESVKEFDLKPIIPPEVKLISNKKGEDWQLEINSCQTPIVELGTFLDEVKKLNAKEKIWVPGKDTGDKEKQDAQVKKQEQLQKIFDLLIKTAKITLPAILLQYEINRKLASLVDQVQKVGMDVGQYLNSKGMTLDQAKQQYQKEIESSWQIELALEKIADESKIVVSPEEVKKLEDQGAQAYMAVQLLRQQKTLEFLLSL
ncbi:MAG: trigger factor [Patescibacteria group bacterium]